MSSKRHFVLLVIIIAALINENAACFQNNEHQKVLLASGVQYYQECKCAEPGITVNNLRWLDTQKQPIGMGPDAEVYTEILDDKLLLYIPSISKSISGKYTCVVEVNGTNKYAKAHTIETFDPVRFIKTPKNQHIVFGKDSTIACETIADSSPITKWDKEINDEFVELQDNEKYTVTKSGLLIKNVSKDDEGKYKCSVLIITTDEKAEENINVDVQIEPTIISLKAYPDAVVIDKNQLTIDCIAEGIPAPEYVWRKKLTDGKHRNETQKQQLNTIYFETIHLDDEGIYECVACNEAGCNTKSINVQVLVPPNVTDFEEITAKEANTVQINCKATGRPEPNITIIYEGYDASSEWELSTYNVYPNNVIITLERSHEGIYICNASNEAGYYTRSMYLTVLHKPYFVNESNETVVWGIPGNPVNLTCDNDSNPPANVTWRFESNDIPTKKQMEINKELHNALKDEPDQYLSINIDANTTYGMYACTARNGYGEAKKIITLKEGFRPPAIKSEIYVTDITATTVTFAIDVQFKEDIPEVRGYTARYDVDTNYEITDIHPNRTWSIDRPYKINKLKPNTTYLVQFAAVNAVGIGEFSYLLNFTTLEKSVPEIPVFADDLGQPTSDEKILIQWKKNDDNEEPIKYYILTYCPVRDVIDYQQCDTFKTETTQAEIMNMDLNTTYFLQVVAYNANGASVPGNTTITTPVSVIQEETSSLAGGAIIALSIVLVLICLLLLDVLLLVWKRQGIIAYWCLKNKKRKEATLNPPDNKGLLVVEPIDTRPDNGHREYEYNKTTGVVTGKHSSV